MRSSILVLILGLVACRAPRTAGSGAIISADATRAARFQEIIERVEPRIIEALSTSWPWKYHVEFDADFRPFAGDTREFDRRVRIGPRALRNPQELELSLTHELVHVHMTGEWRELPVVVQEGVAYWVTLVVLDLHGPVWTEAPPPFALTRRAMTMSYDEYLHLGAEAHYTTHYAAMYLASQIVKFPSSPARGIIIIPTNLSDEFEEPSCSVEAH